MNFIKTNLLSFIALLVMIASSALLWDSLPDIIATDFDAQGEVRDSASKLQVVLTAPLIYLLAIFLVNVLIRISPTKFSMPGSKRAMDIIVFGIGVMSTFIHLGLLLNNGDHEIFQRYFAFGMAAFLVITGNVFGKTERNFVIGIRLPWTIASMSNWKATHRLAGILMVISGLLLAAISLVYSHLWITVTLCVAPLLIPVLYSPIYYWRFEHGRETSD
ncbi:MAG: SdpI family protein [Pseudohongiellaceae bacterium]|jgi:uncharacterized membrane protein